MIVKELLARLGIVVDEAAFDRANKQLGGLTKGFGALVGAATAVAGVKLGFKMAREAAQFEDALRIFNAAGQSLDEFRERAKGTLSDTDLVTKFNFSSAFGVAKEDYLAFIDFSDAAAKKLGKDQKYVFNSIVTGVARLENRWTDNAGMIINKAKVYADYAKKLGLRSSKDLTVDQQRKAFIEDLRRQGQKMLAEVKAAGAGKGSGASDFYDTWDSTFANLKLAVGGFADAIVKDFANPLLQWVSKNQKKWMDLSKTLSSWVAPAAKAASVAFKILAVYGIGRATIALAAMITKLYGAAVAHWAVASAAVANAAATAGATAAAGGFARTATVAAVAARAMVASFLTGPIAIGAAALLIAAIIEELYAMFSTKIGLFETLAGKWGVVSDKFWDAAKDPNKHPLLRFLAGALSVGTQLINILDKISAWFAEQTFDTPGGAAAFDTPGGAAGAIMSGALNAPGRFLLDASGASAAIEGLTAPKVPMRVPFTGPAGGRRSASGVQREHSQVDVHVNINANGASAADKEMAGNVAREVQAVTGEQMRRAQSITAPTPSGARVRGSNKGL